MGRVFARSFLEPLRSAPLVLLLIGSSLSLWFMFAVMVMLAERAHDLPWLAGAMTSWIAGVMAVPVLALTVPLIAGEARDRTLLLNLMQPVSRPNYYSGRALGRGAFSLVYFAATLAGLYGIVTTLGSSILAAEDSPFPPDLSMRVVFIGLTLTSAVLSLSALAPISSSRFGHVVYWAGLYVVVRLARDLRATPWASPLESGFARVVLEILQPFLLGADPRFVNEAALGSWYLQRALLQWAFGIALAYLVGLWAFSKMEVARRT